MDAVNLIGSPKAQTNQSHDWDTPHVAEMVFDACSNGRDIVKSDEVISYVRDNWVNKDSNLKQADDQLRRLLVVLDPGGYNEGMHFQEFLEKFSLWVESEQSRDSNSRSPKIETYETECEDSCTIASSTTESLLSWDYPPLNGYDHISLKKENQMLKEQITSAEVYNSDLVEEVTDLQCRLKNIKDTKSDLHTEVDEQNCEISTLKTEVDEWRGYAEQYKTNLEKLETRVKSFSRADTEETQVYYVHDTNGYATKDTHDSQMLNCKNNISDLKEHISFLKKENGLLESKVKNLSDHPGFNEITTLHDDMTDKDPYMRAGEIELDFTPEDYVSEEDVNLILNHEGDGGPLLASFIRPDVLDDFNNLVTSIAKQLSRVLRALPESAPTELVPKAERQLFTDTLHQMATSKHISEIKIAQLVDLFRKLKSEHRKLGDQHVCLRSDYQSLLSDYQDMKSELVTMTRTNAQLRNEMVTVFEASDITPPPDTSVHLSNSSPDLKYIPDFIQLPDFTPPQTPQNDMNRREEYLLKQEVDELKKKLKGAEKANLTLTLAIEEQTKQRIALQQNIDQLQIELNNSISTISRIEFDNKTLNRDNEKLAETYTRQRCDLDELRKEWVGEMDRCTTIETGYNTLNQTIVSSLRGMLQLLKPNVTFSNFDPSACLPVEEWTYFLNNEFLEATKVAEEIVLNSKTKPSTTATLRTSSETQTDLPLEGMKGNLARASCFEESGSYGSELVPNGGPKSSGTQKTQSTVPATPAPKAAAPTVASPSTLANATIAAGILEDTIAAAAEKDDISTEYQFTTDVASLSKRSIEGEFQAIMLSFENDTFTLIKRLNMHDRAVHKASNNFQTEVDRIKDQLMTLKSGVLPQDKKEKIEEVYKTLTLLPETMETLTGSSFATGRCQQEEKHIRNFEVMVAHIFHTKKSLEAALALCNQNADLGMPKKDVDRAAVRKKTLAVAAAMRKDEEKQKQMQASEHSSVFSSFAGVVKNLMVKTPAEPDLANRRATEMMQRMKTVESLGADKEALYKEGFRGGLSSGLHDTFDNIKKEQRTCDETVDNLNKRASKLEREVAFYKKHSTHLFYGGAATPAATLRTIFCTVFINLFVLFILLITVPLPEHSGYTLGTGYISLQEFITSQFLNVPDRDNPLL